MYVIVIVVFIVLMVIMMVLMTIFMLMMMVMDFLPLFKGERFLVMRDGVVVVIMVLVAIMIMIMVVVVAVRMNGVIVMNVCILSLFLLRFASTGKHKK